jgi:hypothetical protein
MNAGIKFKSEPVQKTIFNTSQSKQRKLNHTASKARDYAHLIQTFITVEGLQPQSHFMSTMDEYKHSQFVNFTNENHLQQGKSKCQSIERT